MNACHLSTTNIVDVFLAATQYGLSFLVTDCIDFIHTSLTVLNACYFAERLYSKYPDVYEIIYFFIEANTSEVLASESFLDLPEDIFSNILQSDYLKIQELDLYFALLRWGEFQLKKVTEGNVGSEITLKDILKNLIVQIRFGLINVTDLINSVKPTNVVPLELYVSTLEYKLSYNDEISVSKTHSKPRFQQRQRHKVLNFEWLPNENFRITSRNHIEKTSDGWECVFGSVPIKFPSTASQIKRVSGELEPQKIKFSISIFNSTTDTSGIVIGLGKPLEADFEKCYAYGGNGVAYPKGRKITQNYSTGDIVSVEADKKTRTISFYKNDEFLFTCDKIVPFGEELHPVAFLHYDGNSISIV